MGFFPQIGAIFSAVSWVVWSTAVAQSPNAQLYTPMDVSALVPIPHDPKQSVFIIVNSHTSNVTALLTRGCDAEHGWAPHPTIVHGDGSRYDERTLTGFDDTGGHCEDGNRNVNLDIGTVGVGKALGLIVPSGWHGKLSVGEITHKMTGNAETLIEGSFLTQTNGLGEAHLLLDFDVSMVDGFSVPLTCSCGGEVKTGCSWDLFSLHKCPVDDQGDGVCRNPLRQVDGVRSATEFFRPCEGAAYTFPQDHRANINGNMLCQSQGVTCCIGASCDPHINQCVGKMAGQDICRRFHKVN